MSRITSLSLFLALGAVACASHESQPTGRVKQAIINGTDSPSEQDGVVMILVEGADAVCTGSLIAPNLVLTARHCVSAGKEAPFACTQEGVAAEDIEASKPGTDFEANKLKIFVGNKQPAEGAPARATGKKIIHDGGTTLCNHDVALIILEQAITDGLILKPRLDAPVTVGETLTSVGWGVTDKEMAPATRKQRAGIAVTRVGPAEALPDHEYETGESICSGDSGGPQLAADNQIVGVVSKGGNEKNDPNNIAAGCVGGSYQFSSVAKFKDLISSAITEAKGTTSTPSTAPDGGTAGTGAAPAAEPEDSGCAMSSLPRSTSPAGLALVAAAALALVTRRKKRS